MKRSPGPPTPCSPLSDEQRGVGLGELAARRGAACARSARRAGAGRPAGRRARAATSSRVATPRIARRVVCGLSETIATLRPTIALTSVDLPTFGRPASATKPDAGHPDPRHASPPGARASRRRRSRGPSRRGAARRGRPPRGGPRCARGQITTSPSSRGAGAIGAVAVDREREHVGRPVLAAVLAVERPRSVCGVDELDRDVAVVDARRSRARARTSARGPRSARQRVRRCTSTSSTAHARRRRRSAGPQLAAPGARRARRRPRRSAARACGARRPRRRSGRTRCPRRSSRMSPTTTRPGLLLARQVDLRDVAGDDHLRAEARAA